jgi:hypothetical protein
MPTRASNGFNLHRCHATASPTAQSRCRRRENYSISGATTASSVSLPPHEANQPAQQTRPVDNRRPQRSRRNSAPQRCDNTTARLTTAASPTRFGAAIPNDAQPQNENASSPPEAIAVTPPVCFPEVLELARQFINRSVSRLEYDEIRRLLHSSTHCDK